MKDHGRNSATMAELISGCLSCSTAFSHENGVDGIAEVPFFSHHFQKHASSLVSSRLAVSGSLDKIIAGARLAEFRVDTSNQGPQCRLTEGRTDQGKSFREGFHPKAHHSDVAYILDIVAIS